MVGRNSMKSDYNKAKHLDSGFTNLGDKTAKLIPIIRTYRVDHLVTAIFAITSWRDNRSAQESCLALNRALIESSSLGNKPIKTYESFADFFQIIEPILKITRLDDMVVNDFGEVQVCVNKQFYPIITGTGHTGSVYSAVQFLDCIASSLHLQTRTQNILTYLKNMIDTLKTFNISQYDEIPITFDLPTKEYFYGVKAYMNSNPATTLDTEIIQEFVGINLPIVKTHFLKKKDEVFPLFNPSLILDYYTSLLEKATSKSIRDHIHSALYQKIEEIHLSKSDDVATILMYNAKVAIDEKISSSDGVTFLYAQGKRVSLFIDADEIGSSKMERYIQQLSLAHKEDRLGFVDLNRPVGKRQFFGMKVPSNQPLDIIPFNRYTNLNETYMHLGSRTDITIFTAVDLMFLLMMSEDFDEIVDFTKRHDQEDRSLIFSWGGITDIFSLWKQEKGYISKGAVEYDMINISFETSAAYVFDLYSEWQEIFPFHLKEMPMGFPEQWTISFDENNVCQFARKGMNPQGGAAFLLPNGGFIFSAYDFLGIMRNQYIQNVRSWRDLVSGLNERFVLQYQTQLSEIEALDNVAIVIQCNSLNTVHENNNYVDAVLVETKPGKLMLEYTVDSFKLMRDISNSKNRNIESQYLLELLGPLLEKYPIPLQTIKKMIINDSKKDKTVDIMLKKLDYYMNPDYLPLRLTDSALLEARKVFAKIAAENGINPGKYTRREATNVVRKMQESLVAYFESKVCDYDRLTLHVELLHYYSSELSANRINYNAYSLTNNIDVALQRENKDKLIEAREKNREMQLSLLYSIETNLFLMANRGTKIPSPTDLEGLVAFSYWLEILQSHSDMCFHTSSDTYFIVLDDYRVNVELGEGYQSLLDNIQHRSYESGIYNVQGDEIDKDFFEKVNEGFLIDTGMYFRVLESVLRQLMECSFSNDNVDFSEIKPNVIRVSKEDAIKDYSNFVTEIIPLQTVRKAYDFLTLAPENLKSIAGQQHPILPVWERKQRNDRFDVQPLLSVGDSYIYSPITMKELHSRWTHGWLQFYPPYEIGLSNSLRALWAWKERYEQQFSTDVRDAFRERNYSFAESDIEIHRRDRAGNHPDLGDYDVIALDMAQKKLFIIECKVLQPVGSVFEHSMQQKGFFQQNKYDEKFQRRIDYLKINYRTFFTNMGYELNDEEYEVNPFMVVNKVFDSYYKKIAFPIVTFDELKNLI